MRFLKTGDGTALGNFIFFVKDTKYLIKFDLTSKSAEVIG
jgi:hypothetical protein